MLGTISYIVALGDPIDQSNLISGVTGGGVLGNGAEVGGLQSTQASTPRLKAGARAIVDYDSTVTTFEELTLAKRQLSQTVSKLETDNEKLRKEVALWQAVEDISGMYKLDELKEIARFNGLKGYSSDGKNALLRRLVKEGVLTLDITPYIVYEGCRYLINTTRVLFWGKTYTISALFTTTDNNASLQCGPPRPLVLVFPVSPERSSSSP